MGNKYSILILRIRYELKQSGWIQYVWKSLLGARPVYVYTKEHINAHFLICFISLVIARLVEIRLKNRYPIERIISSLRSVAYSYLDANHYLFDYADEITDDLDAESSRLGLAKNT